MPDLTYTALEVDKSVRNSLKISETGLVGFDTFDSSTKGIIQFCYASSSQEVHQIDEDNNYSLLTSQTTFADGSTSLADRTIAMYPASGETTFSYWYQGELITNSNLKTLQLDDDGGGYVNFDATGEMSKAINEFDAIVKQTLVAYVAWNTTENELFYFANERHGIVMSPITHLHLHASKNIGYQWISGSDITGLANNGTDFTAIEAGIFSDEDIEFTVAEMTTAPFIYKDGADGQWRMTLATSKLGYQPSSQLKWNNEDSGGVGVWGLDTMGSNTDYVIYTFWQSNNVLAPVVRTIGQDYFTSRSDARDQVEYAVHKISTDGLPSPEMKPIGSIILHTISEGQIEQGSNGEVWVDHRFVAPNGRF